MLKNKRILITCGPTWVPIDAMRVISNRSTGTLGQMIANDLARAGARITLLEGPVARRTAASRSIKVLPYSFFNELAALMKKELGKKYDLCIHAAAVSDYKVKKESRTKLSSSLPNLKLDLIPTQKIVRSIKRQAPDIFLVAFKLESKMTEAIAVKKTKSLFQDSRCDLVVANSSDGQKYAGYILDRNKTALTHKRSRRAISKALIGILKEKL